MVAATAPAALSLPESARSAASLAALDRLKKPPVPTEAQAEALTHLEAARKGLKAAPQQAAAARVAQLKAKLMALKLASGVAAATGDLKAARAAIRDVRDLLKQLAKALRDAGVLDAPEVAGQAERSAAVPAKSDDAKTAAGPPTDARTDAGSPVVVKEAAPADLTQAREDAKGIVKELKKIVAKLKIALVAAQLRGADPKEVKEAEKSLRDTEKELESLARDLGDKRPGNAGVDLRA